LANRICLSREKLGAGELARARRLVAREREDLAALGYAEEMVLAVAVLARIRPP